MKFLLISIFFPLLTFGQSNFFWWSHRGAVGAEPTIEINYVSQNISDDYCEASISVSIEGTWGTITERGTVYATTQNPTTANTKVTNGTGTGNYITNISNLSSSTTYYFRAYAIDGGVTTYSTQSSLTTKTLPTISSSHSSVTSTSVNVSVTLTPNNNTITNRYVIYSTSPLFNGSQSYSASGAGQTNYSQSITGLTPNTTYYYRARIETDCGIVNEGSDKTFTTLSSATIPTVEWNQSPTSITSVSAYVGGNVVSNGGATVTDRGFVYRTSAGVTVANGTKIQIGSGNGTYSTTLTGLSPLTTYYINVYATNNQGTDYHTEYNFTTLSDVSISSVTTDEVLEYDEDYGLIAATITSTGGASITQHGICWNTTGSPTTSNSKTTEGSYSGGLPYEFNSFTTTLTNNTTYYVRAYATNSAGTGYGSQLSFTTGTPPLLPTISNRYISVITQTSFEFQAWVTDDGGATVTERGVVYSTSPNVTTSNGTKVTVGSGEGIYTTTVSGLSNSTTYYVRGYAINSVGTSYTTENSVTTLSPATVPLVRLYSISSIEAESAWGNAEVTSNGGATTDVRGIVWNTTGLPGIDDYANGDGNTGTGTYSVQMAYLIPNTTYYVRAFAINSYGIAYSPDELSFTTLTNVVDPTVSTNEITSITPHTASGGGNVTDGGGASVTARGVVWSTSSNPTISLSTKTSNGTGTGSFTSSLSSLTCGTTYYVRAYATNSAGTEYGNNVSFTTSSLTLPIVFNPQYRIVNTCYSLEFYSTDATVQEVKDALDIYRQTCQSGKASSGYIGRTASISVGEQGYHYSAECTQWSLTGRFMNNINGAVGTTQIIYISNGVIQEIILY